LGDLPGGGGICEKKKKNQGWKGRKKGKIRRPTQALKQSQGSALNPREGVVLSGRTPQEKTESATKETGKSPGFWGGLGTQDNR